jgi:hypothetical protein
MKYQRPFGPAGFMGTKAKPVLKFAHQACEFDEMDQISSTMVQLFVAEALSKGVVRYMKKCSCNCGA